MKNVTMVCDVCGKTIEEDRYFEITASKRTAVQHFCVDTVRSDLCGGCYRKMIDYAERIKAETGDEK